MSDVPPQPPPGHPPPGPQGPPGRDIEVQVPPLPHTPEVFGSYAYNPALLATTPALLFQDALAEYLQANPQARESPERVVLAATYVMTAIGLELKNMRRIEVT